jgi:Flp pilus assembly protein TadD
MKQRIAIIPTSVITGLVLAIAGVFNVWGMENIPPLIQPLAFPVVHSKTAAKPHATSHKKARKIPSTSPRHHPSAKSVPTPTVGTPPAAVAKIETAVTPMPPIRIEHSHESDTVDPILLAAWQAYRNGDFDIASQHYSEVLRKNAQNHNTPNRDALLGMAAIAQRQSQDAVAAQYYGQVLALDPRDPYVQAGMSSLLGATGVTDEESRLKLLLAQRPEVAALHFALGNHYAAHSRWGDAQPAYFNACALESDNAQFAYNLAVSLDHLGQGKLAAQYYRRALQLDHAGNTGSVITNTGNINPSNASFDHAQTQLRLDELTPH